MTEIVTQVIEGLSFFLKAQNNSINAGMGFMQDRIQDVFACEA